MTDLIKVTEMKSGSYQVCLRNARMYDNYIVYSGDGGESVFFTVDKYPYQLWADLTFAENYGEEGYVEAEIQGKKMLIGDPLWRHIIKGFDPIIHKSLEHAKSVRERKMVN